MGFRDEMEAIVRKLPALRRRILLSATEAVEIPRFVQMGRTLKLDYLIADEQVPERVGVFTVESPEKDKLQTLKTLLLAFGSQSSIVFLNYRESVERTADYPRGEGFYVSSFHGGLEQKEREAALYQFSNGSSNILVSTDLASRGLDIPDVDNIIHYHLPESEEGYVHRVGRSARWNKQGRAFFILAPGEQVPAYVQADIHRFPLSEQPLGTAIPQPRMATVYIGKGKKDKISKGDIVGFLCKTGGLTSGDIGRIDVKDRYAYAAVSREKLEMVINNTRGAKIKGIKTLCEVVK